MDERTHPVFERIGDRRRSELLAGLLLTLLCLGLLSGLVQLATVPGFFPSFVATVAALAVLAGAYVLSRTAAYRVAAVIASLVPTVACFAVLLQNPDDRVALSYMVLSVVFATTFLSTGAATMVAVFVLSVVALATMLVPALRAPDRWIPAVGFLGIMSTLLLLAARQRNRLEAEQDRRLLEADLARKSAQAQVQELEAQLSAAQRFASIGRLSAGVGHDLNNLLGAIVNAHQGLDPKLESAAAAIRQADAAAAMATRLVSHMLALARSGGETSEPRVVDLNAVLKEADDLLSCATGGHCKLVIEYEEGPLPVRTDPLDLQRILLNLATNAGKAMPAGGTLRIEVLGPHRRPGPPTGGPPGPHAAIVVSDTGSGMERGALVQASFVGTRSEEGGQGLGLAIVKDLVRRRGAHLDVWSQPGQGTRFTLFLPLGAGQ